MSRVLISPHIPVYEQVSVPAFFLVYTPLLHSLHKFVLLEQGQQLDTPTNGPR